MAKLYFYYGAMGSSKSANAMMVRYNYWERGQNALLVKSEVDTRDGINKIRSRMGLEEECITLSDLIDNFTEEKLMKYECIIVDEAQFATAEQIDYLSDLVDNLNIPVMCYGLRCDFKNQFFEGSRRLMELADTIQEIKTVCWCGKKAICNMRYNEDGVAVKEGEQIVLGANDKYVSVCRKHFKEGNLGPIRNLHRQ
ncbi:MAG TPA: thymidine kinase [Lachnospiraceae bacterium]|nr:thymidine kinase [uncultured Lachnoclostridium sp.]HAU85859.1 thymidine kinase [Lachnospiraceae bacterium]